MSHEITFKQVNFLKGLCAELKQPEPDFNKMTMEDADSEIKRLKSLKNGSNGHSKDPPKHEAERIALALEDIKESLSTIASVLNSRLQ